MLKEKPMTAITYTTDPVKIICRDRFSLNATVFTPDIDTPQGVVVISAALGVGQGFYRHFAAFLCEQGFYAVTFDYRGINDPETDTERFQYSLKDWAVQDINAVIEFAATLKGSEDLFLIGHSVGGQIFCLAEQSDNLTGVILVAASFPFWKRWAFPRRYLMYLFFHILIPVLGMGKLFPAKRIGLSKENLPSGLIKEWGRWARHPDYLTGDRFNIGTDRFKKLAVPMLSFGFSDDTYVPQKAIQRLHRAFEQADIDEVFIRTEQASYGHVGHFGFFRKGKTPDLWEKSANWLKQCMVEKGE